MPYAPEAGDLIWTDFDPRTGREQSGRRPALVVSPADFSRVTEFAIVCPITSRVRAFGTSVVLPSGLPVSGEILTTHVRSIDTLARPVSYAGATVPAAILDEVRSKLAALGGVIARRHLGANIGAYRTGYRGEPRRVGRSVDAALCTVDLRHFFSPSRHIQVREMPYFEPPCSLPQ